MQISVRWLQDFISLQEPPQEIGRVLTGLGLEVEEIRTVGQEYEPFRIAAIERIEPHPTNANWSVCQVRLDGHRRTIVTGAPNVRAGCKVVVALPGTALPRTDTKVEVKTFGGVVSEGMLCSRYELGLSDREQDKHGIWILPDDAPVGSSLLAFLQWDDTVLDIALTPNRADCLSHLGIARELSAYYQRPLKQPEIHISEREPSVASMLHIEVREPDLCPRYAGRIIRNVTIGPSPQWLQQRLLAVGLRPRNVVVDVTNYVLMELGQPLHAFDYDRIAGAQIIVRRAVPGEQLVTLDGKERVLDEEMLVICDAEKPIAIAGVMGGANSEITEQTRTVFLESAYFQPTSIRRTAKRLGLSTEASYRFERGVDIENVTVALDRAAAMIAELTGGIVASGAADVYPGRPLPRQLRLRYQRVRQLLGVDIPSETVRQLLQRLHFPILQFDTTGVVVAIPSFRVDIDEEIDLVEEVARLWGYDNIVPVFHSQLGYEAPKLPPSLLPLPDKQRLIDHLIHLGFVQLINPHMLDPQTAQRFDDAVVRIANPLGEELSALRTSLIPSIIRVVDRNVRVHRRDLRIFEVGKVFRKQQTDRSFITGYAEEEQLIFALTGSTYPRHWGVPQRSFDFFDAKGLIEHLLQWLRLESVELRPFASPPFYYTADALQLVWQDREIGSVGQLHPSLLQKTEVQQPVFVGILQLEKLAAIPRRPRQYHPVSPFPPVERDLAFVVDQKVSTEAIQQRIVQYGGPYLQHVSVFDVFVDPKLLGPGKKSVAFGLVFNAPDHTLTDEEVQRFVNAIIDAVTTQLPAKLRV